MSDPTLPKIFEKTGCLSKEELLAYAGRSIEPSLRHQIEKHLIDCPLCSEAVDGLGESGMPVSINTLDTINLKIQKRISVPLKKKTHWSYYYAVAAVLLIGFMSILVLTKKNPNETLYTAYYEPYPNAFPLVRGEIEGGTIEEAMTFYEKGEFDKALPIYNNILIKEPDNHIICLYKGISLLETGNIETAIDIFQIIIDRKDPQLDETAKWYAALAYLKKNDMAVSKKYFNELIQENSYYKEKAQQVMENLEDK